MKVKLQCIHAASTTSHHGCMDVFLVTLRSVLQHVLVFTASNCCQPRLQTLIEGMHRVSRQHACIHNYTYACMHAFMLEDVVFLTM
jgi:hypothetical protein